MQNNRTQILPNWLAFAIVLIMINVSKKVIVPITNRTNEVIYHVTKDKMIALLVFAITYMPEAL